MGPATEELVKLAARLVFQQFATPDRAAFERRIGTIVVCGVLASSPVWPGHLRGRGVLAVACAACRVLTSPGSDSRGHHAPSSVDPPAWPADASRAPPATSASTDALNSNDIGNGR